MLIIRPHAPAAVQRRWLTRCVWLPSLHALVLSAVSVWGYPLSSAADEAQAEQGRVVLIGGAERFAKLTAISTTGEVTLSGEGPAVHLDQLWRYQPAFEAADGAKPAASAAIARVNLLGGGYLLAEQVSLAEEQFRLVWNGGEKLTLPLEGVHSLRRLPSAELASFTRALAQPSDEEDQIFLQVGDKVESIAGLIESITAEAVDFQWQEQARQLPWRQFHGVVFAALEKPPERTGRTLVALRDGSQLLGQLQSLEAGRLRLLLTGNATVEIPWSAVRHLEHHSPRMTMLSEQDPAEANESPLVTFARGWQRNRSVLGGPLRVGDQVAAHGIGVAATSQLTYELQGRYDRLLVTVGIDRETAGRGDCVVAILVDGRTAQQARITGRDAPLNWQVDLRGARRVTLSVEPGAGLDLGDHVDWIEPRLLRGE